MIQKKTKQIIGFVDGAEREVEYEVEQFPAMQGIRISVTLAKTFSGAIGKSMTGKSMGSLLDADIDFGSLIAGVLENLDEEKTPNLITDLLAKTKRNGVSLTREAIDKVYAGNYKEMILALVFVLEVNYGGFMAALDQADTGVETVEKSGAERKK